MLCLVEVEAVVVPVRMQRFAVVVLGHKLHFVAFEPEPAAASESAAGPVPELVAAPLPAVVRQLAAVPEFAFDPVLDFEPEAPPELGAVPGSNPGSALVAQLAPGE